MFDVRSIAVSEPLFACLLVCLFVVHVGGFHFLRDVCVYIMLQSMCKTSN